MTEETTDNPLARGVIVYPYAEFQPFDWDWPHMPATDKLPHMESAATLFGGSHRLEFEQYYTEVVLSGPAFEKARAM